MNHEEPLLRVESLTKRYDGKHALDDVDVDIRRSEVLALTGENGAGKSTLVKILTGTIPADSGRILFDGRDVVVRSPADARALGIAAVQQDYDLAPNMTVAENLVLGMEPQRLAGFVDRDRQRRTVAERLAAVRLDVDPGMTVARLSAAERQLVSIAKAVASSPRLLVLDEPTSTLASDDIEHLLELIGRQRAAGNSVLLISHKLDEILRVSDRVCVLRDGRNAGNLRTADTDSAEIISRMVGRTLHQGDVRKNATQGEPLLELRALQAPGLSMPVELTLRRGEIVGLYGLKGSGRFRLLRTLYGLDPLTAGEIVVAGRSVRIRRPVDAIRHGIAWACRDRKALGVFGNLNLRENLTIAALDSLARCGFIDRVRERDAVADSIRKFAIRNGGIDEDIASLSGGNQQKVMLARWLLCAPRILILDEPTAGIDVGARSEFYRLTGELAQSGLGILLVSSDLPEILLLGDRFLVMHEGAIAGELDRDEASEVRVMELIHDRRARRTASGAAAQAPA